jgi:UPF0716 protein FxsA
MFGVLLAFLLVLPFLEIWVAIQIAGVIGAPLTFLLLIAMSVAGFYLLRGEGTSVWRRANEEMAAGRVPTQQLLDGALVLIGGVCLIVPGFITGVFGALLLLPPVRSLVRPLLLAWMARRAARLARSGRMSGIVVDTVVDAQGRVRTRTRTMGDVVDSDGWEAGDEPSELPVAGPHSHVIDGHVVDGSGGPDGGHGDGTSPPR